MAFDHERLDVYQTALDFIVETQDVVSHLPRGRGHLVDQLQRAATSIVLNIAEGAGEFCYSGQGAVLQNRTALSNRVSRRDGHLQPTGSGGQCAPCPVPGTLDPHRVDAHAPCQAAW